MLESPPEGLSAPRVIVNERRNFGRGEVHMLRVTPDVAGGSSKEDEGNLSLLFAQGHGQDKHLLAQLRSFAAVGEDTFGAAFVGPRRSIKWLPRRTDRGFKSPQYQVDKAEDMMAAMESMEIAQANVVTTSEGALRTMIAVAQHPEKFRDIILVHPAGMDDKGFARTHARVVWHYATDIAAHPRRYLRALISRFKEKQPAEVEVSVPRWKKFITRRAEQNTVALSKFHELAAELKQAHPHLEFLIIGDEDDRIYPPDRLRKANPTIRVVTSRWGGHGIKDQQSVNEIVGHLKEMEQARRGEIKS